MKKILLLIVFLITSIAIFAQQGEYDELTIKERVLGYTDSTLDTLLIRGDTVSQWRYLNMADPSDDLDGVNKRYLEETAVVLPVVTLPFDTTYTPTDSELKGEFFWDEANNTFSFKTGLESTAQVARESLIKVYNNNGVVIPNGDVIGTDGVMPDGTLTVSRAIATNRYDALLWATTDIPVGEVGDAVVVYGSIRDVPTLSLGSVGQVWLSAVDSGKVVKTKPSFPAYEYSLGAVTKIHATEGQYEARLDGIDPYSTTRNTHNGQFRETIAATVASDGATITLSLERSGGGDLTQMWSSGLRDLDCTPAKTIALTAGTDISPQPNYVYILQSNPDVLVVSTSGFPKNVEYEHIFDGALFTATRTQTDDALSNRNWNDHIQDTVGQGHLLHISERIRQLNAQWNSGMAATMTIGGGTTLDISATAGDTYQLHLQNVDAMNTATGSYMYVQNDFTTAWNRITDIENITLDANGNSLTNTSYSLVMYSVANKSGESDQYVLTVPTGVYSKNTPVNAENDLGNYAVYDFPSYLKGKAVLVAKFNLVNNNGTISLYSTQDLRGKVPNAAIGGGGKSTGAADFLSLLDTYSSYSGLAYTGLKVDLGESGLIATQWTEDASGNINAVGTISENSVPVASSTEIIDTIYTAEYDGFNADSLLYDINSIPYYITSIPGKDGIVEGGLVSWQAGLIFDVSPALYYINGTEYQTGTGTATLSTADPTNARIDVIVVDTFNQVDVVEGTPGATPVKPTVNPLSQIELTFANVGAGATEPTPGGGGTVVDSIIYNENVEWTGGSSGVTVDFASVADPYIGTISADVGTIGFNDYITFTSSNDEPSDFDVISLFIKLKAAIPKANGARLYIYFLYDGVSVSNTFRLPLSVSSTGWQNLSVGSSDITFTSPVFDEVRILFEQKAVPDITGFYLDYIKRQGGYKQPATVANPVDLYVNDSLRESGISKLNFLDDNIEVNYSPNGNFSFSYPENPFTADSIRTTNGAAIGSSVTIKSLNANYSELGKIYFQNDVPGREAYITGYREANSNRTGINFYTYNGVSINALELDYNGNAIFPISVTAPTYGTNVQTLTETAGAVAWDMSSGSKAKVTIDETSVITITNMPEGAEATIRIVQGDAGDDNVTFVLSGATVEWRGDDTDLTDASGAVDYISVVNMDGFLGVTLGSGYVTQ